jgi:hypothetical protein
MRSVSRLVFLPACAVLLGGCAAGPAPIPIYDTPRAVITVAFDPRAGRGHSHPADISAVRMAQVLGGVRVSSRNPFGLTGALIKAGEAVRAFKPADVVLLTRYLTEALRKASPMDVATFYLADLEPGAGQVVTSGGVFVRNGDLFLILANHRTALTSGSVEATAYELDNRDQPLLPLARFRYTLEFTQQDALVPNRQAEERDDYGGYLDESKLLVIELARLAADDRPAAAPAAPARP